MFELTRQNLSSRCDLCLLLQTLCWTLWGNFLWGRHITLYLCMGHQFQVIKRVGNFDKNFNMGWNGACKSVCDLVTQYANNNMTVSMTCQSRKSHYRKEVTYKQGLVGAICIRCKKWPPGEFTFANLATWWIHVIQSGLKFFLIALWHRHLVLGKFPQSPESDQKSVIWTISESVPIPNV